MSRGFSFQYKQIDDKFRPIVAIELEHTRAFRYEVLIDSGADICIFHADIGRAIGLDVEAGEKFELGGATGTEKVGYLHVVTIKIASASYQAKVGFSDHIRDGGYGMVGQKGFFDRFAVKFDYAERSVVLHKKKWA